MEQDVRGEFVNVDMGNGVKYSIYVPENVNPNTPIFTYIHGSGGPGGDWSASRRGVLEHGSNSIVIMPTMAWNRDWGAETMNIVSQVQQKYGLTNTNVSSGGFSMGGFSGYTTLAANLRQNPDSDPQVGFFIDDYSAKTYYDHSIALADEETMNLFRENNSVFFMLEPNGKGRGATNAFGKSGLNVIRVACDRGAHTTINADFFANGMYDYMAGGELPKENYHYQIYNQETGKWEEIPYESISTIDALYDFYGLDSSKFNLDRLYSLADIKIKSDDKTLENHLNSIRGTIRNAQFLKMNYSSASFLSTTKIPQAIPEVIKAYFDNTASLLNSIARKTVAIAKIAGEIEYQDMQLADRASVLNSSEPLYSTVAPIAEEGAAELIDLANPDGTTNNLTNNATNLSNATSNQSTGQNTYANQSYPTGSSNQSGTTSYPSSSGTSSYPSTGGSSYPSTGGSSYPSGGGSSYPSSGSDSSEQPEQTPPSETPEPQQPTTPPQEELPIEEQFPKYEEVYSNDNQIVYNYNDEYKVVIHYEDDKITAIEHYYDFETKEAATTAVEQLQTEYKNVENFDKIIQNDRYVKVLFKEEMYVDKTVTQIKEQYNELKEVVEKPIEHLEVL